MSERTGSGNNKRVSSWEWPRRRILVDRRLVIVLVSILCLPVNDVDGVCLGVTQCTCEATSSGSKIVNCRSQGLTTVPRFTPPPLGSTDRYSEVTLAGNGITSIPARSFVGLSFQTLDLTDNPLVTIDPAAFTGGLEGQLQVLLLTLAPAAAFPAAGLAPLTQLRTLHVTGFAGTALPPNATWTLTRLSELQLVSCSLTTLNAGDLVAQRGSLKTLVLRSNNIAAVPTAALSVATMITNLDLSFNRISGLAANAFTGLVNLDTLDLSNNGLGGNVDAAAFVQTSTLKTLRMQFCQLDDRSTAALTQLQSVTELYLAHNSIANLPRDLFSRLRTLRVLSLDSNRLTTIDANTFASVLSTLESLNLGHNPLSNLPANAFNILSNLRELYLDGVTPLTLNASSFTSVQQSRLGVLSLRETNIGAAVWPVTSRLTALGSLYLSRCALSEVPDFIFRRNTALRLLDLSTNTLSSVTQRTVYGLSSNLQTILLTSNRIATMAQCTFSGFNRAFSYFQVGLGGNPLHCDCGLRWLYTVLRNADSSRLASLPWTCDNGRQFASLTDTDFAACPPVTSVNCSQVTPPDDSGETTSAPLQILVVQAKDVSYSEIVVDWKLRDGIEIPTIVGFIVTSQSVKDSASLVTDYVGPSVLEYKLAELVPETEYRICVAATLQSGSGTQTNSIETCTNVATSSSPHASDTSRDRRILGIALGCVIGGLALIGVAVAVYFIYRHRRLTRKEEADKAKTFGGSTAAAPLPHVWYGSRRYARRPAPGGGPTAADWINGQLRTSSVGGSTASVGFGQQPRTAEAFTAEERAKIFAMLDATRGVTAVGGSSAAGRSRHSSGTSGRSGGFKNAAYDPAFDKSPPPMTNVYDAIPWDHYDEVPLDSVV